MLPTASTATSEQGRATYIGVISGVLSVLAVTLGCVVLLLVRRGRQKVSLLHKHAALMCSAKAPALGQAVSMKDLKSTVSILGNGGVVGGVGVGSLPGNGMVGVGGSLYGTGAGMGLGRARLSKNGYVTAPRLSMTKNNVMYGQVVAGEESDSENSMAYHEPYKLLMPPSKQQHQEYGCLLGKELTPSKSSDYAGAPKTKTKASLFRCFSFVRARFNYLFSLFQSSLSVKRPSTPPPQCTTCPWATG